MTRDRLARAAVALLLLGIAFWITDVRRAFIRVLVSEDAVPVARPVPSLPDDGGGGALPAVERVRVVLIDGLGLSAARTLPHLNKLCSQGDDLVIDVGFPTVSLPVQVALWSGLTQQQTGIVFRSGRPLEHPLAIGTPAGVPGSLAIAESHPYIIRSLGFSETLPIGDAPVKPPDGWSDGEFATTAKIAVASDRRLVFVHSLGVDGAGHKHGARSAAYRDAASDADALLGALAAEPGAAPSATTRWFILSDHGHLASGGHGDIEPSLRLVRACVVGGTTNPQPRSGGMTLVDVSRAIADSLAVSLPDIAYGRPYQTALGAPALGATLPSPEATSLAAAGLLLLFALALTLFAGSGKATRFPYWWALAFLGLLIFEGSASMSTPMMYPPKGRTILVASLPGFVFLALHLAWLMRTTGVWRALLVQLAIPAAGFIGALALAGGLGHLFGSSLPATMPWWTAQVSVMALYLSAACAIAGLATLATAVPFRFGPSAPLETPPARP